MTAIGECIEYREGVSIIGRMGLEAHTRLRQEGQPYRQLGCYHIKGNGEVVAMTVFGEHIMYRGDGVGGAYKTKGKRDSFTDDWVAIVLRAMEKSFL